MNRPPYHKTSLRIPGFDYTEPGYYFITVNTIKKRCLFGEVLDAQMIENDAGRMVKRVWLDLQTRFPNIATDISQVMPNHFHGILVIKDKDRKSLGDFVGAFKSITTIEYIKGVKEMGWPAFEGQLWQRNYYEHVIRDEPDYERIYQYIQFNDLKWTDMHG